MADTVIDEAGNDIKTTQNTGIVFAQDDADDLLKAIIRGLDLYADKAIWKRMQLNGMRQDFSWKNSALQYMDLYTRAFNQH